MIMDNESFNPASMWIAEYNMPYQMSSLLNNVCCQQEQNVNMATSLNSDITKKAIREISKKT